MVTNEWAVKVNNLSKRFDSNQPVHALNDVSFQLNKGNILGLIGNNGAGKSTLLKIISGLLKPDHGTVSFRGQLSSILDIGSGFHPDLSGFDNIYLAGRIMGLSDEQIDRKMEEIITFSELQNFIQTPLKYYSSGMFLRLAFTTSTCFQADILLLDEIMSVGDLHFQQKSKNRILQIVQGGSTVIIAGHNIEGLSNICTHGLWLTSGKQTFFGEINEVVDKYLTNTAGTNADSVLPVNNEGLPGLDQNRGSDDNKMAINDASARERYPEENGGNYRQYFISTEPERGMGVILLLEAGVRMKGKSYTENLYMDGELEIRIRYEKQISYPTILFVVLQDKFGHNLMSLCDHRRANKDQFIADPTAGVYEQTVSIPAGFFNQGIFTVSFYFANELQEDIAIFSKTLFFRILKSDYSFGVFSYKGNFPGTLLPFFNWKTEKE